MEPRKLDRKSLQRALSLLSKGYSFTMMGQPLLQAPFVAKQRPREIERTCRGVW